MGLNQEGHHMETIIKPRVVIAIIASVSLGLGMLLSATM